MVIRSIIKQASLETPVVGTILKLMAANFLVRAQIWPKFKLIKAINDVLITCIKRIDFETTEKKWRHQLFRFSRAVDSTVSGQILQEIKFNKAYVPKRLDPNNQEKVETTFPRYNLYGFFKSMVILFRRSVKTRDLIRSAQNPNAAFASPQKYCG